MKILGFILLIGIIIIAFILITSEKPSEDLQDAVINEPQSTVTEADEESVFEEGMKISELNFSFRGFGPGKSHPGTFENIAIENLRHDGVKLVSGTVRFVLNSVKTDNQTLDGHLCGENFFDCENYPEAVFTVTDTMATDMGTSVTGDFTLKGVTKSISFEAKTTEDGYATDFNLNVEEFGFGAPGVNKEVQITFTLKK